MDNNTTLFEIFIQKFIQHLQKIYNIYEIFKTQIYINVHNIIFQFILKGI